MNPRSDALRRRILRPWSFKGYLWSKLPLAACAGLQLRALDDERCTVALPGGWRTQNPFRSTYFAAQSMAAEMSTGAPALVLASGASASVALLVVEVRGVFSKKIQGESLFTFDGVRAMSETIDRAAASLEPQPFTGVSVGRTASGEEAARFEVTWSFRRRS